MASLFISYSRKDIDAARKLTEAFPGQDLDFWIDWEGIEPTLDWWKEIEKGIEQADNFLFLISPDSCSSAICRREIEHAVRNGKRLIPVVVRDDRAADVPSELGSLNWIFLRTSDDFEAAFGKLIRAVKTDFAWVQFHRRLQVKALEWERGGNESSLLLRGRDLQDADAQLVANTGKEPQPTSLQRDYVLKSRHVSDRQRRITTGIAFAAAIVMAGLAIFGFNRAAEATAQTSAAQTAQANAEESRQLADERAAIARAGELAAQSNEIRDQNFQISLLLAIEAFAQDTVRSRGALLDATTANPQLLQFLMGHTGRVNHVAFDSDGAIVASGGDDATIVLWDVQTRQPIGQPLTGHTSSVTSLTFSPDGKILASGSCEHYHPFGGCESGELILWDIASRQPIGQPLTGHTGHILDIVFSPDGKIFASCGEDHLIILWDVETRQPIAQPFTGHTSIVRSIDFSPDGAILASGSQDQTIILWNVEARQPIGQILAGHPINSLVFSPDGKILASGSQYSEVVLWDVESRQPIGQILAGHSGFVSSLAFSPDGKILASGSGDQQIILWDVSAALNTSVETRPPIGQTLAGHSGFVSSLAFSPDGKILASGSGDTTIALWDVSATLSSGLETRLPLGKPLTGPTDYVWRVAFSSDGKILASGSGEDTIISLWDIVTQQPLGQPLTVNNSFGSRLTFSPDGKIFASVGCGNYSNLGCDSGELILWDVEARQPSGPPLKGHSRIITSLAFSPDGAIIASGSSDASIILWHVETRQPIGQPITGHTELISGLAFSPDGKILASGSCELPGVGDCIGGELMLWDVETRQSIGQPLTGFSGTIDSLAFSPDGAILASSSSEKMVIHLWEVATRQPIGQPLTGHTFFVSSLAFSPNSKILASGSQDTTIILWDVEARQPIGQPLTGHTSMVTSVAFSPDGKILASGSQDTTIILWEVRPEHWKEQSCQRVGRNFTRAEWERYFPPEEPYRKTCKQWPLELEATPTP